MPGKIAFVALDSKQGEPQGNWDLYVIEVATAQRRRLSFGLQTWDCAWSPDGQRLVFDSRHYDGAQYQSALYLIDADGAHLRRLPHEERGTVGGLKWLADGRHLSFATTPNAANLFSNQLSVMEVETGDSRVIVSDVWCAALSVDELFAWSPTGHEIAFVGDPPDESSGGYTLGVVGADCWDVRLLAAGINAQDGGFLHPDLPAWSPDGRALAYRC